PLALQQCFGSTGFLDWNGTGEFHLNNAGPNGVHVWGHYLVTASVVPEGTTEPSLTLSGGPIPVNFDALVQTDPVPGSGLLFTPTTIDLVSADGTMVIHTNFNFYQGVSSTGVALFGLVDYHDITCSS